MKKVALIALFLIGTLSTFAQQNNTLSTKHEIKLNLLYSVFGAPEISYEYALNDDSAIGLSVLFGIAKGNDNLFAMTPYYRYYFSKKPTAGFFVEGFGMFTVEEELYNDDVKDLALGTSFGWKFLSKKGFVAEINAGLGISLLGNRSVVGIPRVGISFGKRF